MCCKKIYFTNSNSFFCQKCIAKRNDSIASIFYCQKCVGKRYNSQGWAIALLLFRSFTLRTLLFRSFQKEQQGVIRSFALFQKNEKERFALSLFTKTATKSTLLFRSFKKNNKEQIALLLFTKRAKERTKE